MIPAPSTIYDPLLSTATQTIQFLNDLYNKFDKAIDNYDVYKVSYKMVPQAYHWADTCGIKNRNYFVQLHSQWEFPMCLFL